MSTDRVYLLKEYKIIVGIDQDTVGPVDGFNGFPFMSCFCFYSKLHNVAHIKLDDEFEIPEKSISFNVYMRQNNLTSLSLEPYSDTSSLYSMKIGMVVVSEEKAKEFDVELSNVDEIREIVLSELKILEDYLNGETYLFYLYKELEFSEENFKTCDHIDVNKRKLYECIDACSGFYGYDIKTNGILDYFNESIKNELMELYHELKEDVCQSQ